MPTASCSTVAPDSRRTLPPTATALSKGQADAETAKAGLTGAIYAARAAAAKAKAVKKQGELDKVMASINETVSTIMTVGKMASMERRTL